MKKVTVEIFDEPSLRRLAVHGGRETKLEIWVPVLGSYVHLAKVSLELACDGNPKLKLRVIHRGRHAYLDDPKRKDIAPWMEK